MRRPCCMIAPELGGLLFGAQFTYLTHAPQRALTGFLRLKSEIADGVAGPAHNLESFARWRSAFKDARLAMEQFSQVVTCDCFVHFIHFSHLFPFSCFLIRDLVVTHELHLQERETQPRSRTCQAIKWKFCSPSQAGKCRISPSL